MTVTKEQFLEKVWKVINADEDLKSRVLTVKIIGEELDENGKQLFEIEIIYYDNKKSDSGTNS